MKLNIRSQQDFWSGVMFIAFGLFAMWEARNYPMGQAMRMGPGYFPTYLGALLVLVGAVVTAMSIKTSEIEKLSGFAWRPLITLCAAFLIYGFCMEQLEIGFIPSIALVVVVSSFSAPGFRPLELVMLTAVLCLGTTALFIWGLELPYPLFWWSY